MFGAFIGCQNLNLTILKDKIMKLSVIMPVFNEKETLQQILERVKNVDIEKEIIIIDDCSTDGTKEILGKINDNNIKVIYHSENKGKGSAIKTARKYITGDVVIIQDADLEYQPEDYHKLIKPIEDGFADVVYGSRFLGIHRVFMFWHHLGNKLLTWLTNILYNTMLTDIETCYKVFRAEIFKKIDIKSSRFDFEAEVTAKIFKQKLKVVEMPITYYGRGYEEGKKITWKDGFVAIWTLIKYRFVD